MPPLAGLGKLRRSEENPANDGNGAVASCSPAGPSGQSAAKVGLEAKLTDAAGSTNVRIRLYVTSINALSYLGLEILRTTR